MPEDVNLEEIKELVKLVEKHGLAELTVEENGVTVTIKGVAEHTSVPAHAEPVASHEPVFAPAMPMSEAPVEAPAANLVKIESPMVGVFYRAPSPDQPAFIEVGDVIELGQTIGMIEAMKVFSEIPSEVAGEVVEVPAQNSKLVQQGETLVVIRVP